jgi:hypothetical protein
MKKFLLFIFCISLFTVEAQNGFTTYTNSLVTGTVKKQVGFVVDNSGNKWIAYWGLTNMNAGLLKYDNSSWTLYNTASTPAMPTNSLTTLAKDNSGNLWIGSRIGLIKFDGTNFTTYTTANGLISNTITCIETVGNQVYVGTSAGLSRFDGISFTNYNVAGGTLPSDAITCIKAETSNLLWLGGNNRLIEFTINSTFTSTSFIDHSLVSTPPFGNATGTVNCIYIDSQNMKWLGTVNVGLVRYNGSVFNNAIELFDVSSTAVTSITDIAAGLHNGIVFKHAVGSSSPPNYAGLTELCPNGKIYQYYTTIPYSKLGNYIENDGSKILISANSASSVTAIYYEFNEANYTLPFGSVNSNNFKMLDINQVRAGIANRSDMHWDIGGNGNAMYEVPKGSWINSSFASALWIGGLDAGGQLHGGAQTYRQTGNDFWPGPLDTITATIDSTTARNYDKIWKVSYTDINNFITAYNMGSIVATEDMLTWPAHGTGNNSRNLAPFVDHNGDGIYNPNDGDYPKIKGDQALYFIYNDKLATHSTSYTPMGVEVQAMAYAYGCPAVVNGHNELTYTTFYDYKIINRSSISYHDVFASMWTDADLGQYSDDYIGCNVADNYGYIYNGDADDNTAFGTSGYGAYMPAQGYNILKGPMAIAMDGIDNNNNGVIDEANEDCKMNKFTFFNNSLPGFPTQTTDPQTPQEYYNYTAGFWKDGTPFTCGGNAYGGTTSTNWVYSTDPNTGLNTDPNATCGVWTESSAGNIPGDRRMLLNAGPFNLGAGQMQEIEYAFVTSFDSSVVNNNLISLAKLKTDIQKVNAFYNQVNKPNCLQAITVGVTESLKQNDFMLYPNPARSLITLQSTIEGAVKIDYEIVDVLGKTIIQNQNYNNSFTINISDLTTGIYFIRLRINNSLVVKKFVKE